ncbi:protein transport protein Sec16A isoform X5 [Pezoporus flaviventris]|uniref:protein transport protein Sec16A isoform X5 n=1 Tax=Pezoporus flaviventris TaxID=889875 RepID=UPI002AB166B1|nr:protein transport protein Sec16A isoform X5 [Pezoporus flaviventris]
MQQPPQPVPAGAAAPPPAGIPRNMYRRNSSLSKRANAPAAPVQPVTYALAFGKQTPQGSPVDNPSKGSALVMQSSSPTGCPQPAHTHTSPPRAGDNPHGLHTPLAAPVPQPGINPSMFSNVPVPSPSPGYAMNSTTEVHPNADPGFQGPVVPLHYSTGAAVENSFSVHPGMAASSKPGGRQDVSRGPNDIPSGPSAAAFFPPPPQQPMSQWRPVQGNLQSPVRNFVPYSEPSSQIDVQNISQSSVSTSHPPLQANFQQGPVHQGIPQNAMQAPLAVGCEKNGKNGSANSSHHMNSIQPGNVFRQNTEMTNAWLSQPYQEQFYPQPPLQDSSFVLPTAQENNPQNQAPDMSETTNRPIPTDQDPGTLSMFFKGDEAENEEILSSEKDYMVEKTEFDACQPNSASLYHQPVHPQRIAANVLSQAQVGAGSVGEMVQKGMDQYFPKIVSQQEAQATKHSMFAGDDKAHIGDMSGGSQYENVENLECIQNQEVLPSEPQNISVSSPAAGPDLYRYGSFPGQMLPKNAVVSHAEGGPNLEAPDSLPHPVRPDSVSSNYSTISHRSASSSARPQEQVGTFIQQESGKPDEESSASFFKQIDSSPLGVDSSELNLGKTYHGNLSQPPTPSPPKPTGVFQTSANSSFEPVRSHGVGIKPAEIDQAKMVVELRENHSNQKNIKNAAVPAASPGNLEQPPDNLETIFMPPVHPLPLAVTGEAGNMLHSGPVMENMQSVSERRSSTRAQGAVKKCDSPATTLWAHNDLPNFGGNVLLAPAAPAVYVPAKQTVEVIQPPEEGLANQEPGKPGTMGVQLPQDGNITSENLENPPKMGEEEALQSQVTKDVQHQAVSERAAQGALPSQPQMQGAQMQQPTSSGQPSVPSNYQVTAGAKAMQASQQHESQVLSSHPQPVGPQEATSAQQPAGYDQMSPDKQRASGQPPGAPTSSAPSSTTSQPAMPNVQQDLQRPSLPQTPQDAFGPPQNPYYYYRHPYDPYQPPYPPPYPPADPRTAAHLYYMEDAYGQYDPRYRHYDSSSTAYMEPGSYRYPEPERPSSRASHCSDRPSSRQGYAEDYYAKSGWSDYYPGYYPNSYDYGDPSRWERYSSAYDPRYRDPRSYDQRYWYDAEHNPYQKREAYPYGSRHDRYDENWRYDPRFTGSFDDESEPHRDPYGDEFDRRSVHSEHSGHSLRSSRSVHSHQSSFSSRSQQSQLYRSNHDLTANTYETAQAASLHADYPYGGYAPNFDGQQPFTDYGYPPETGWSAVEQAPLRPSTPEKFSVPHICARFGPGGFLIKVLPNLPSEGQPALVEIHSMETMLQHSPEQEEMRAFPGPLAKDDTHKVDVINFAQNKATQCFKNENLIDKESASLLWDFIVLLCRQNGTVVGTDLAELLLRDHKTVWLPGKSPNEANLIDFTNEAVEQAEEESGEAQLSFLTDNLLTTIDSLEKETERFRELLLYGRKKDALESAMKHGLWGHALLLASKMDSRTHARVMTRFANSLPINDPLQTVYQLMSGRMPAASTCCGDEKWGDWRPHLAMVLSNLTNNVDLESRTIATMGDTLASKGLLDAAHFCYLMAQVGFGVYTRKTTKLVLIGSNHSLPFFKFATNEAIQRTEAYEYAQSLGTQPGCLPNFQVFKFIYACRLAEMGLAAQAFHYCEVISRTVLKDPHYYSPVLIDQLIQMSSQLRLFDPQIKEKPEQESFIEPSWLVTLRHVDGQIKEGAIAYNTDRSTPPPYACSTPSSELDRASQCDGAGAGHDVGPGAENALLASLLPNVAQQMQSVQLMPSVPQADLDGSAAVIPPGDQEAVRSVPFYPVASQSIGPGPGFAPPGFSNPYGTEPSPLYLGSAVPPGGPPQENEPRLEEQTNLETGMQRIASESPAQNSFPDQREEDFYGRMASMAPGRRSRSASQSSAHMGYGRRSRTTSESSAHSVGRERSNSAAKQSSPPSVPVGKETKKETKKEAAPRKTGATWFRWLMGKGKNEAHLPDDKNKSIVWDEQKQRWVNLDEPEEESKPPPPPPTGFPKAPQAAPPGPGGGPGGPPGAPVNMFSRRAAGSRARYVDVLNPGGTKSSGTLPAPSDLFAPLAPMPIPANVFVPNSVPGEPQPMEGSGAAEHAPAASQTSTDPAAAVEPEYLNPAILPPGSGLPVANPDGSQSGELSRSSSMSSLSREVSQHFNQPAAVPPAGGPSAGAVPFYNPSQFAQSPAVTGSSRPGRIGQRKYPTLK